MSRDRDHFERRLGLELEGNEVPSSGVAGAGRFDALDDPLDARLVEAVFKPAMKLVKYFRTTLDGVENLPWERGCLCVSNHAVLGIDAWVLFPALYRKTGRMLRGLGEHNLFKVPLLGEALMRIGAVDGTRDNAVGLMRGGHWAICYPGGISDSFKRPEERYQLKWHNRVGYLRAALAADVPIVPIAGIGIDDAFIALGNERRLGRRLFGSPKYDLPIFVGLGVLPLPVKFRFVIDRPIDLRARFGLGPSDADAPLEELLVPHSEIWTHTQALIERELSKRNSRFY
jgi:1-acyl-sn-glycerol-3-phosphate acyltransferase